MGELRPFTSAGFCNHLEENILPFWLQHSIDKDKDGFYGRVEADGTIKPDANKALLLNTRILWSFSEAYLTLQDPGYKLVAERAYTYIKNHFIDEENGGVHWMLNADGDAIDPRKQVFAQAYTIYSLSSYHRVTQDNDALMLAIELFQLIEEYAKDEEHGGYCHTLDHDWEPVTSEGLEASDKILGSHLHLMEAYTNLLQEWPDDKLRVSLHELVNLIQKKIVSEQGHLILHFNQSWEAKGDAISYGHDIEGAWLMLLAVNALDDKVLIEQVEALLVRMVKAGISGIDQSGLVSSAGSIQGISDASKQWWPQLEAIVGLTYAGNISGDERFSKLASSIWTTAQKTFFDTEQGEWFAKVNVRGEKDMTEPKIGPWKAPYHITRCMLQMMQLLKTE